MQSSTNSYVCVLDTATEIKKILKKDTCPKRGSSLLVLVNLDLEDHFSGRSFERDATFVEVPLLEKIISVQRCSIEREETVERFFRRGSFAPGSRRFCLKRLSSGQKQ